MFDLSSPTVYIPTIFVALVAIFASIFYKDAKKIVKKNTKDLPYYTEISLSMGYIDRNILENGRFKYRNNVNPEIEYDNDQYNSLRHAGVLYSMYLYEILGLENKYHDARLKASKYFVENYIKKIDDTRYAVISNPKEEELNINLTINNN